MSSGKSRIGVGVIGIGFMGQTHIRAYRAAAGAGRPCELVAVCDSSPAGLTGEAIEEGNLGKPAVKEEAAPTGSEQPVGGTRLFDPAAVGAYTDPAQFFADPRVDAVSVCTYTDTHVEMALRALAAGKHVLVEKPVAIASADVRRLAEAAAKSKWLCTPAMCMRYWPGWDWLRERVGDGSLGAVRSATFQRLGSGPRWGRGFYRDTSRSGGALVDLHIHDADFIYWCFGRPESVWSGGTTDHVMTEYRFRAGPSLVCAEGAWDLAPAAGFRMRYLVAFESATADYDLGRTPPLLLHTQRGSEAVPLSAESGYEAQVRSFLDAVSGNGRARATMEDAVAVAEVLEAERKSLATGRAVRL